MVSPRESCEIIAPMIAAFLLPLCPGAGRPSSTCRRRRRTMRPGAAPGRRAMASMLFDGRGGEWIGRLQRIGKTRGRGARVLRRRRSRTAAGRDAGSRRLPAADKMDWIVQKAVELGVAAIRPVAAPAQRHPPVRRAHGAARRALAGAWPSRPASSAGAIACRRSRRWLTCLNSWARPRAQNDAAADSGAGGGAARWLRLPQPTGPVTLLIGPEGGFEEGELAAAQLRSDSRRSVWGRACCAPKRPGWRRWRR